MLYRDSSYERSVADPGRNRIWTFHVAIRTYLGDSSELVRVRSQVGGRQRSVLVGQSSELVRVRSQVGGRQRSVLVGQSSEFWLVS